MKRKKDNSGIMNDINGITITDSISLTINSKYWINSKLLLFLTAIAGIIGFTLSLLTLFEFPCNRKMIFAAEAIVFMVCAVIFMFPSKTKLLLVPVYVLMGYSVYRMRINVSNGYAEFINIIAGKLKLIADGHSYYKIPPGTNKEECLTLFLIFLFAVITTIIAYNTIIKPRFLIVFSSTFPFIEAGLMFGFSPDHFSFSILIAYWISVFAMRVAGNQYHSTSGQPVFVRKRNIFVSSGNLRNNVIEDIGIITLISVFAVFILSSATLKLFSYERPDRVNDTRHNVKSAISDFPIEKIAHRQDEDADKNPITDKSRLGNLSKISFRDRTDLSILLSEKVNNNLYIKGFVGCDYKENSWYSLSEDTFRKNKDLFNMFSSTGIYPQYFNSINDLSLQNHGINVNKIHMIVSSKFKSNSYIFAPYSTEITEGFIPETDAFLKSDNMSEYSFSFFNRPEIYKNVSSVYNNSEYLLSSDPERSDIEKSYSEFVYSNYLSLPDRKEITFLKDNYSVPEYNGSNISDIYKTIRSILHNSAEYTLEPGRTPADTELTYYLLTENHKGYCSHFATAGVVLARLAGVPARYAEGYVVVPSDLENAEEINSYYKVDIHDSRAHAWAEFYIDGYGWVPFEFTPGYDNGIVSAETSVKSDTTQTSIVTVTVPEQTTAVTVPAVPAAPVTTAPTVTKAPSSGNANQNNTEVSGQPSSNDNNEPSEGLLILIAVLKVIVSILIIFLIIIAVIFTRHIIYIRKRIMSFRCKSNNQSISNVYKYVLTLLKHIDITKGNMLPLDFAEYIEEKAKDYCDEGKLSEIIRLTLKASFSTEEVTAEELKSAVKTAYELSDNICRKKSRYEQLVFRYILNLSR